MLLAVHLDRQQVGELSSAGDRIEFRLFEAYRQQYPRPVLGQIFEDDLDKVHRSRIALPPFFSNLLPEGALRGLLAAQIGVRAEREPALLAHVGEDLPGAVRVTVMDNSDEPADDGPAEPAEEEPPDALKFSLAGVQLKFSALRGAGRGLTIPAHGRGGEWIVKLPDPRYGGVPENEWAMMTLARRVGLDVADVDLVPVSRIEGLPGDLGFDPLANALAVRRFDRSAGGGRVHAEDFAQVLDVRPTHWRKYHATNFETLASYVSRIAPSSTEEFVRRLVFNAAIGNGDAHIKNWSLLYPDGVHPVLSPAYDLVSTIQYIRDDNLGLNLARSKRFEDASLGSIRRLAEKAELALDAGAIVLGTVARIRESWSALRADLPIPEEARQRIEAHWARVPLMSESG